MGFWYNIHLIPQKHDSTGTCCVQELLQGLICRDVFRELDPYE